MPSKNTLLLNAMLLASLTAVHAAEAPKVAKPNFIVIYSDDHGWADLGEQGVDQDIRTPNLDQLARDGVRFKRGYVSAPQCVPSRAGVITGRYQQRFGVDDNLKGPLPLAELTIAERLKPAGYTSCQIGKWHLTPPPRGKGQGGKASEEEGEGGTTFQPWTQGFEEYYTGPMNSFMASHDLLGNKLPKAPQTLADKRFRCVWQADAAVSFIERHARDPFFLYLAFFTPHVPLESPEPWFAKTPAHLPKERRQALAMIAAMDEGIGKLRETLRARGLDKNTLIFFIGDNGAPLKEGAWDGSLNTPLIGEKGMLTDGGVRTPFVAAWPGTLPAGKVFEPAVINLDVAATAVALAGLPHDSKLDGVNLMPFLLGKKSGSPHDVLFWRWRTQAAVLEGNWKLILLGPKERYLFDVTKPDGETLNLLQQHPEIAARLETKLRAWDATLKTPGLPTDVNAQDQFFFDAHVNQTGAVAAKRPRSAPKGGASSAVNSDAIQGWLGRNCSLTLRDGALHVAPAAGAKAANPFITHSSLNLTGPLAAAIRLRTGRSGQCDIAWRLDGQKDFALGQSASSQLAATNDWQTLKLEVPAKGTVIHLRLMLPPGGNTDISSIELQGADVANKVVWSFDRK